MYNGIGLPTPRGSGTNGYVQRNVANVSLFGPSRKVGYQSVKKTPEETESTTTRKPDPEILQHERRRKAVVLSLELEEKLRTENILSEEQIQELVSKVRTELLNQNEVDLAVDNGEGVNQLLQSIAEKAQDWKKASIKESKDKRRRLQVGFVEEKPSLGLQVQPRTAFREYDIHRKSLAKEKENLKLKNALGLRDDYQPGDVFRSSHQQDELETKATTPPLQNPSDERTEPRNEVEENVDSSVLETAKEDGELEKDEKVASLPMQGEKKEARQSRDSQVREREESHKRKHGHHHSTSRKRSSSPHYRTRHRLPSDNEDRKRRHRHSSRK